MKNLDEALDKDRCVFVNLCRAGNQIIQSQSRPDEGAGRPLSNATSQRGLKMILTEKQPPPVEELSRVAVKPRLCGIKLCKNQISCPNLNAKQCLPPVLEVGAYWLFGCVSAD